MMKKIKTLFLIFFFVIFFISGIISNICLAQAENQSLNFVPQPLVDLFNIFSNWKIDFSRVPLINKIPEYLPQSGEDVGRGFQWFGGGLSNLNNWLIARVGLNILLVIKKVGEFFVWTLEWLAKLLKIGLSYI